MEMRKMLLLAAMKRQKGSIIGIFLLVWILSACIFSSLTLLISGNAYVKEEMERLGFGELTIWINGEEASLTEQIQALPDVEKAYAQPLIFSGYEINGGYSDNEGQLLVYDGTVDYRFLNTDGTQAAVPEVADGTVYISPAMQSGFDVAIGDTIQFELSRKDGIVSLSVAGYFADGFMGSSMIDMKSFLINDSDYEKMQDILRNAKETDVLGRNGAMVHVFQREDSALSALEFSAEIQENTDISLHTEFSYRQKSILSYMLLLQNILCGIMIAFSMVLTAICLIVTGHSLSALIEQDKKDIAALKTIGLSRRQIRSTYLSCYGGIMVFGFIIGLFCSGMIARLLARGLVSSTGMLVAVRLSTVPVLLVLGVFLLLFALFLMLRTRRILKIAPVQIFQESVGGGVVSSKLRKASLEWDIAMREIQSRRRNYIALCLVALVLTIFLSVVGRMGSWLGPNGEGLMNAFSVADHDLGVQPFNRDVPMDEIERVINWYSPIRETYELAMESVTVNGQEYEANVLNDIEWFHLMEGELPDGGSILITETVANELELGLGDMVRVAASGRAEEYSISGIYQCANGMGSNIGMSMEGYSKIGDITGFIWCHHYVLEDGAVRDYVMNYLQKNYRGIDVHTNSWSGLDGIVSMMHGLIGLIYLMAAFFILIAVALSTGKLLTYEAGTMAVYKSMGLSAKKLRRSFAFRFLIVSAAGTVCGLLVSAVAADGAVGMILRNFGIGQFRSEFSILGNILPLFILPALFFFFAWAFSAKLKQVSIINLINEDDV
ncbi:MAG: FtsX-like permease family protein [Lachnospiraceae bacterium]|nr:FtsX-like permease family protein [Lachnospiraceae bacterium]